MDNKSNIVKYRIFSNVYDAFIGNKMFNKAREAVFSKINFLENDQVLLVGVGTGQDLKYLPNMIDIVGIDLSDEMLKKAEVKAAENQRIKLIKMNAEELDFKDKSFDYTFLNLILSVVGNPRLAMEEALRVTKHSGRIIVLDKFVSQNDKISFTRKLLNKITTLLGTDINRNFEDISAGLNVRIIESEESIFKGNYRIIVLEKV